MKLGNIMTLLACIISANAASAPTEPVVDGTAATPAAPPTTRIVVETSPAYFAVGADYLSASSRSLTGQVTPHLALGWGGSGFPDLIGAGSLNLDWGHAESDGNRIDTYGLTYAERIPIKKTNAYLGLGLGPYYSRIKLATPNGETTSESGWRFGGRGMVGFKISGDAFIEVSYFFSGQVRGISTNALAACLGIWF